MCTAGLALQAGGAATSAVGSYYGAQSNKATLGLQATLGDLNARVAESAAQSALFAGQRQEQGVRIQTANTGSSQRVALAANGVDVGEGTAARVQASNSILGEIDANTVAANAVRAAWGYRTQATNNRNDALTRRAAADGISPLTAGATSLLGSAAAVSSGWYRLKKGQDDMALLLANGSNDPIGSLAKYKGW